MKVAVASAIQSLTQDEDEQQELWVRCLENGNDDVDALSIHLTAIRKVFSEDQLLQVTLWRQAFNVDECRLLALFDQFTDLEQQVMRLLALGADLDQISGITRCGVVRLRHIISVIREHDAWKNLNGP
jgi:hypothetical protein